jgi:hypothetical protein
MVKVLVEQVIQMVQEVAVQVVRILPNPFQPNPIKMVATTEVVVVVNQVVFGVLMQDKADKV